MLNWKYDPEDYSEDGYALIPEGRYRVKIDNAKERISRTGKEMVELTLKVNGYNSLVWFYLVLDDTDAAAEKRTNDRLSSIFSSFQIPVGNLGIESWIGKTGGAKIRHRLDERNEKMRAEVHYFLYRKDVETLPEWRGDTTTDSTDNAGDLSYNPDDKHDFDFNTQGDSELPF